VEQRDRRRALDRERPGPAHRSSDDRNLLKADVISLRRPVSRRVKPDQSHALYAGSDDADHDRVPRRMPGPWQVVRQQGPGLLLEHLLARRTARLPKETPVREGRLRKQIRRAFVASGGKPLTTGQLAAYCYPRLKRYGCTRYARIRRAAGRLAYRIGRLRTGGRPLVWAPKA
jgi:hypothetical protein